MKKILATIMSIMMIVVLAIPAYAYNTYNDHVLIGGVGKTLLPRHYYIASSANNFSSYIAGGVDYWNNTASNPGVDTPVNFASTPFSTLSTVQLSAEEGASSTVLASTSFLNLFNVPVSANSNNWTSARITIYSNVFDSPGRTAAVKKAVICHEFGHAFGLAHSNSTPSSIMCQLKYGRTATRPSIDDCNGINHLYPF